MNATAKQLKETAAQETRTAEDWEGAAMKARKAKDYMREAQYMGFAKTCRNQADQANRELEIMGECCE